MNKPVAVIGGGIAGMSAALYLAKAGIAVTVFEKDAATPPNSAADVFDWDRRGAPQIRHSHGMLARMRNLLRDDHPEVLQALLNEGAMEMKIYEDMPTKDGSCCIEEADKDIVLIACRRATLEWVMRKLLSEHSLVTFQSGLEVNGLIVHNSGTALKGITLKDRTVFETDVVIAADGRRSNAPTWLNQAGIELPEDKEEPAGIVYYSRFYKLNSGVDFPTTGLVANDIGYLFYAAFCGDNRHFSMALSANEDDEILRKALQDPENYEKALRQIPELQAWVSNGEPVSDVFPMGGLINRRRHFVKNGTPLLAGFHVLGDAHICTNPAYGRGLSMAMWQAKLLTESVIEHPDDPTKQTLQFNQSIEEHIVPWLDIALMMDGSRHTERERLALEGETHAATDNPMKALADAASVDPEVWRTFWRAMNMLAPTSTLMSAEFIDRIVAVTSNMPLDFEPTPANLPNRDEMIATLGLNGN